MALLSIAAFVGGGCQSAPVWRSVDHDQSFDEMWRQLVQISDRNGFSIDRSDSDKGRRQFVSKWRTLAAPFGMGSRLRVHGEFDRREDDPGWTLRFYVERQSVSDVGVGFDPQEDDWEHAGQESSFEERILAQLRLAFGQSVGIEAPAARPEFPSRLDDR